MHLLLLLSVLDMRYRGVCSLGNENYDVRARIRRVHGENEGTTTIMSAGHLYMHVTR